MDSSDSSSIDGDLEDFLAKNGICVPAVDELGTSSEGPTFEVEVEDLADIDGPREQDFDMVSAVDLVRNASVLDGDKIGTSSDKIERGSAGPSSLSHKPRRIDQGTFFNMGNYDDSDSDEMGDMNLIVGSLPLRDSNLKTFCPCIYRT